MPEQFLYELQIAGFLVDDSRRRMTECVEARGDLTDFLYQVEC